MNAALLLAAAGTAAYVLTRKPKRGLSPFTPGCRDLTASQPMQRWLEHRALPRVRESFGDEPMMTDLAIPRIDEAVRFAIEPELCEDVSSELYGRLYKAVWCMTALDLSQRGLVDEEPADIISRCLEPEWDPQDLADS